MIIWKPPVLIKDPDAARWPCGLDYTKYLAELGAGVTIVASTWAVTPSGLSLASSSIVTGDRQTQVRLSGGTADQDYVLTNHITCSDGSEDDRSRIVRIRQQ